MSAPTIELKNITKKFAKVLANDNVSMNINRGEVLALLGENGAGKSTIMKILYGLYRATSGKIFIDGEEKNISNPREAINYGISMIQQHFSLVNAHTVTENIILGNCKGVIDYKAKEKEIQELADHYHFEVPAGEYIKNLTVGEQQKVEILKALYLDAKVLIMDEPTAVLTPQEAETLMQFIRDYAKRGNSVVFISHKMQEVLKVSDRIIVMRNGCICGEVSKEDVSSVDEATLAYMMIGRDLEVLKKPDEEVLSGEERLVVEGVSVKAKDGISLLKDIHFSVKRGEILGFAGVSGNGQQELCEVIYGVRKAQTGNIYMDQADITVLSNRERIGGGIGYVASDRYRYGMVKDMALFENMLLKASYMKRWIKRGIIDWKKVKADTDSAISEYSIKAPDCCVSAGSLSGGNQQKLVVAREVEMGEKVIIFDQPTRGLDLGAINYVHKTILREKEKGKSIILVSTELSEIFALADRIAILYKGEIMGIYKNIDLSTEKIGLLMAGVRKGQNDE